VSPWNCIIWSLIVWSRALWINEVLLCTSTYHLLHWHEHFNVLSYCAILYGIVGRDSVVSIATLRAGRSGDRIPLGARFSAPIQTGPGAYPASCTMGTRSFSGVKQPGRGVDHPPPSSAKVNERIEVYLYSPSGSSWPVLGWTLPLLYGISSYEPALRSLVTTTPLSCFCSCMVFVNMTQFR
jgi:hypothetical protein